MPSLAPRLGVARGTVQAQQIVNTILHSPSVRRSTSFIAMSEQIAPHVLPLLQSG